MTTESSPQCPLCDRTDVEICHLPDRDAYACHCPACGNFVFTREVPYALKPKDVKDKRYILSALTRRASDRKERLELLTHNVDELLKTTAPPKAPYDVIDPLLVAIHDGTTDPMSWVRVSYNDYPLFFLRDATQLKEFLSLLSSLKLIEIQDQPAEKAFRVRLSLDGWDRVADLRKTGRSRSRAFVAMSFSKDLDTIYDEGIKPALIGAGYTPIRLDTDLDDVHFDTRQYNHIVWRDAADFREQLHTRVLATVHAPVS